MGAATGGRRPPAREAVAIMPGELPAASSVYDDENEDGDERDDDDEESWEDVSCSSSAPPWDIRGKRQRNTKKRVEWRNLTKYSKDKKNKKNAIL